MPVSCSRACLRARARRRAAAAALAALLAGALGHAQAQPAPAAPTEVKTAAAAGGRISAGPGADRHERDAVKWFNLLDANGDGKVSLDEGRMAFRLKPSLKARFDATDSNRDGFLTESEIRAAAARQRAEREARRARERAVQAGPAAQARPASASATTSR